MTSHDRRDSLRDPEGRPYFVAEWDGNLYDLTDDELGHRIEELGAHIGRLTTEYNPTAGEWRMRTGWHNLVAPAVAARLSTLQHQAHRNTSYAV